LKSAAAGTEAYEDVTLDEARVSDALALSSEAGWNQVADDWRLLFRQGTVFGRLRRGDGALVGSAAVLPLGSRLSWIGMVLVTAAERRRGHARQLMHHAMEHIGPTVAVTGLDATPAGRDLYHNLGFTPSASLVRMGRLLPMSSEAAAGGWARLGHGIRRATIEHLPLICSYDAKAFAADRASVLHDFYRRAPEGAFLAEANGRVTGFVLARPGRLATQIGPLAADDPDTAERLLRAALAALPGRVIVDVFANRRATCDLLGSLGFTAQRPFTRMLNAASPLPDDRTVLSAGPELG
jgi:GNAT superfamily N-acetyltransferase